MRQQGINHDTTCVSIKSNKETSGSGIRVGTVGNRSPKVDGNEKLHPPIEQGVASSSSSAPKWAKIRKDAPSSARTDIGHAAKSSAEGTSCQNFSASALEARTCQASGAADFSRSASSVSDASKASRRSKGHGASKAEKGPDYKSANVLKQSLPPQAVSGSKGSAAPSVRPPQSSSRALTSADFKPGACGGAEGAGASAAVTHNQRGTKPSGKGLGESNSAQSKPGALKKGARTAARVCFQGRIVKVLADKQIGFISSDELLQGQSSESDIFFHFERLKFGRLAPVPGDYVIYTLDERSRDKQRAREVRPAKLAHRPAADVERYCCEILDLVKHPDAEHGSLRDAAFDITYPKPVWALLLNSDITDTAADYIVDFVLILSKLRGLEMYFTSFLENFCRSKFLDPFGPLHQLMLREPELADQFVICLLRRSKTVSGSLTKLLSALAEEAETFYPESELCHQIIRHLLTITTAFNNDETNIWDIPWDEVPLVPKIDELFGSRSEAFDSLSPVLEKGSYETCDYYLETYFRLLRCDCFAELNDGIRSLVNGNMQKSSNMCTYSSVVLKGIQLLASGSGIGLVVQVKADKPPKDWKSAPHLRFGNLICISPLGRFKDPIWAVVANRDVDRLQKDQTTYLELCGPDCNRVSEAEAISMLLSSKRTLMVESPTFYKAFEPVLKALQKIPDNELPFDDMLVCADFSSNNVCHDFLSAECRLDASLIFKLDKIASSTLFSSSTPVQERRAYSASYLDHSTNHRPALPGAELVWSNCTRQEKLNGGVVKYTITNPGSSYTKELCEYNMAFAQFSRLVEGCQPKVQKIDVYENPAMQARFDAEQARMAGEGIVADVTWVFHGTSTCSNIESIMVEGFKVGGEDVPVAHGSVYGRGVYSATSPNTPMMYAAGVQQVILALALKEKPGQSRGISWEPRKDWIVFRSGSQLLPRYVVHFSDFQVPQSFVSVGIPALVGCTATKGAILSWISNLESQPESTQQQFTDLDQGQLRSIRIALENRISLIQGPPGTGKTFIGVKIVQMLLSANTFPNRPILVLTYKNHALDEFLVDCMKKIGSNNIIRVGGRSGEPSLESRNLHAVKKEFQKEKALFEAFKTARTAFEESKAEVKELLGQFRGSLERLTVDEFLDQAYEPQTENLLLSCNWAAEQRHGKDKQITGDEVSKRLKSLGEECPLHRFLQLDLEGETKEDQTWLLDALERALDCWYPAKAAFQNLNRVFVNSPPALFESLDADHIEEELQEVREIDAEDEEPERVASEPAQTWDNEDFVKFESCKNLDYLDVDIPSVCSEAVASCLRQYTALWELDQQQRACLVCIWMQSARQKLLASINTALKKVSDARKSLKELQESHEADVLRQSKIVGMTITGAAMRADMIAQLKPPVIMVEEAAEVLEAQMLACIGPWVQRLVMIGDHKQLRPQVACYELEKKFKFDVSMFERLINNGIEHGVLNTQNRMRPEFVLMLKQIYPSLRSNHGRVDSNVAPSCVANSMFFWTHSDPEMPGQSVSNTGESERVVALALFFVQQGYLPSQITVLAGYRGQTRILRDALRKNLHKVWDEQPVIRGNGTVVLKGREIKQEELFKKKKPELQQLMEECELSSLGMKTADEMIDAILKTSASGNSAAKKEIRVHTIDQYQGDENDIIIVSLVRSNKGGDIGFLNTLNRYCVAVSRARCGVYFVGNDATLCKKSKHWQHLCEVMRKGGSAGIGRKILLRCPRHPTSELLAEKGADIDLEHGLCHMRCDFMMPCGMHQCGKPCHAGGAAFHDRCMYRLRFRSPCGHDNERFCYVQEGDFVCQRPCKAPLPCGHPCLHRCGQPCSQECQVCIQETRARQADEEDELKRRLEELLSKAKKKKIGLYPAYWRREGLEEMSDKFRLLDVTSLMQRRVQMLVDGTCNSGALGSGADQKECGSYSCLRVVRVERVENPALWRRYSIFSFTLHARTLASTHARTHARTWCRYRLRYTELLADLRRLPRSVASTELGKAPVKSRPDNAWNSEAHLDKDVREHYLFHGTSADTAKRIANDGFEERVARLGGLYGAGAYFAEQSNKSDQYTKADADGIHRMFVARVLLGAHVLDSPVPQNELRILPEIPTAAAAAAPGGGGCSVRYSSLLGLFGVHREFVVYDGRQAYPEYLVHYQRR